ncbi:MAG: diaminopimelate epimerase, partial [Acidimicrobiia bacterium]|nr:diaminopimelate epimerase [Acidimicrobiia bacterium]
MDFVKMHGLGNDFVVFDGPLSLEAGAIQTVCDRRTGIGADGILVVTPSGENEVRMGYWNAD